MNNSRATHLDWNILEKKWTDKWKIEKIFQANFDPTRKKYFVTVAYPYPNSPQHIGHGRTYTLADAHARYMRMKGRTFYFLWASIILGHRYSQCLGELLHKTKS